MKTIATIVSTVLVVVIIGLVAWLVFLRPNTTVPVVNTNANHNTNTNAPDDKSNLIKVTEPVADALVKSPLTVKGEARGTWFFEASFPVKILDADGKILGITPAQAQENWMTESFVPFMATLAFDPPTTATGTLVLEKDNPSGEARFADELRIPIRFDLTVVPQKQVKLYFYNASKDMDAQGNVLCTQAGVVPVMRSIPLTQTPIQDTIKLLFAGGVTNAERTEGITTEFPLAGVALKSASVTNGALTLNIDDPQHKTSGGACRASILWYQIEATAKQFAEVKTVTHTPVTLFQP